MRTLRALGTFAIVTLIAGCTSTGRVGVETQLIGASAELSRNSTGLAVDRRLVITRVRINTSEIEIEGGDDEQLEADFDGGVIEVALGVGRNEVRRGEAATGQYHTLSIELQTGGGEAAFGEPGATGSASIIVEGTFGGEPFEFRSALAPEVDFGLDPPLTVPKDGEVSVVLPVDPAAWFRAPDGGTLDPRSEADRAAIEQNLVESLSARAKLHWDADD